jgi:hypothetical protein
VKSTCFGRQCLQVWCRRTEGGSTEAVAPRLGLFAESLRLLLSHEAAEHTNLISDLS